MLPADVITAGRFDEIRNRTAQLVALAGGAGAHPDPVEDRIRTARTFTAS
jgi:hypothetical protein